MATQRLMILLVLAVCIGTAASAQEVGDGWKRWSLAASQKRGEDRLGLREAILRAGYEALGPAPSSDHIQAIAIDLRTLRNEADRVSSNSVFRTFLSSPLARQYRIADRISLADSSAASLSYRDGLGSGEIFFRKDEAESRAAFWAGLATVNSGATQGALRRFALESLDVPQEVDAATLRSVLPFGQIGPRADAWLTRVVAGSLAATDAEGLANAVKQDLVDLVSVQVRAATGVSGPADPAAMYRNSTAAGISGFAFAVSDRVRGAAEMLNTFAVLTGDKQVQKLAESTAAFSRSAGQVYEAAALLSNLGSGWGAALSIAGFAKGMEGFAELRDGRGAETAAIMGAIKDLFDRMEKQFSIVNGRLDKIVAELNYIRSEIADLTRGMDAALSQLALIHGKLDGLIARVDRIEMNIIAEIEQQKTLGCTSFKRRGILEAELKPTEYSSCLEAFVERARHAHDQGRQLQPDATRTSWKILEEIVSPAAQFDPNLKSMGQALEALKQAEIEIGRSDLRAIPGIPNPNHLASSTSGYLKMALDYPKLFKDYATDDDLSALSAQISTLQAFLTRLATGSPDQAHVPPKENFQRVFSAYEKAVTNAIYLVDHLENESIDKTFRDLLANGLRKDVPAVGSCDRRDLGSVNFFDGPNIPGTGTAVPSVYLTHFGGSDSALSSPLIGGLRVCFVRFEMSVPNPDQPQVVDFSYKIRIQFGEATLDEWAESFRRVVIEGRPADLKKPILLLPHARYRLPDGQVHDLARRLTYTTHTKLEASSQRAQGMVRDALRKNRTSMTRALAIRIKPDQSAITSDANVAAAFNRINELAALVRAHAMVALGELYENSDVMRTMLSGSLFVRLPDLEFVGAWASCAQTQIILENHPYIRFAKRRVFAAYNCSPDIREAIMGLGERDVVGDVRSLLQQRISWFKDLMGRIDWSGVREASPPSLSLLNARIEGLRTARAHPN